MKKSELKAKIKEILESFGDTKSEVKAETLTEMIDLLGFRHKGESAYTNMEE